MILKQKSTLILYVLSIMSYLVFYIFFIGYEPSPHKVDVMLIGALLIIYIQLFLIHLKSKNLLLMISIVSLIVFSIIEILIRSNVTLHQVIYQSGILSHLYYFVIVSMICCHGIGIYLELLKQEKNRHIHIGAYESNQALIIDLYHTTRKARFEFSEQFASTYHLDKKVLVYTFDEVNQMLMNGNQVTCISIDDCINLNENHRFDIAFPFMDHPLSLIVKRSLRLQKKSMLICLDITYLNRTEVGLENSKKEIMMLETESEKIIRNTGVYISKMKPDGTIIFASDALSDLYTQEVNGIVGLNAIKLSEKQGNTDHAWFSHTLEKGNSTGNSVVQTKQGERHIAWKNDCLYNQDGEVEYLITVGTDVTDIVRLNEKLKYQSTHDTLTGLLNYHGLIEQMASIDLSSDVVSLFIDVKDLSNIRDYYGNDIGDMILKKIAYELISCAGNKDLVSRYYGDQFVILAVGLKAEKLQDKLLKLEKSILSLYQINQTNVQIKKSIGYAIYPYDADHLDKLITQSSLAMKASQKSKHNEIVRYDASMTNDLNHNISIAYQLHQAITNQKIEVHFQKVMNTKSDEVYCIEALARWKDEALGFVRPDYFFEVAQDSNLIDLLEEYVIHEAIKSFAQIKQQDLYHSTKLSVNLTPHTLLKNGFSKQIIDYAKLYQVHPKDIIIEVSENTFVHNLDVCNHFIQMYQKQGFLIAIDDFGSQYSSLSILEKISYDIIKIDGSFIKDLEKEKNMIIISMIKNLANIGHKQMIAEAVETLDISHKLHDMGCVLQQGFYFHKPEKLV